MFCIDCAQQLADDWKACPKCGRLVETMLPPAPPPPPKQQQPTAPAPVAAPRPNPTKRVLTPEEAAKNALGFKILAGCFGAFMLFSVGVAALEPYVDPGGHARRAEAQRQQDLVAEKNRAEEAKREAEREREARAREASRRQQEEAERKREAAKPKRVIGAGELGYLASEGPVFVGATEEAENRLTKLAVAKDKEGILQMVVEGEAALLQSRTQVRIIDQGMLVTEVRILEGDYAGKSVFVPSEFIKDR